MAGRNDLPTKICASCGREFEWRKAWERAWDQVRFCSQACKKSKPDRLDAALEQAILDLLGNRARGATICPSEAARAVAPEDWRPLMERTRRAGRRLCARERVDFTQGGRVVDPSRAKGPVRLRLR